MYQLHRASLHITYNFTYHLLATSRVTYHIFFVYLHRVSFTPSITYITYHLHQPFTSRVTSINCLHHVLVIHQPLTSSTTYIDHLYHVPLTSTIHITYHLHAFIIYYAFTMHYHLRFPLTIPRLKKYK